MKKQYVQHTVIAAGVLAVGFLFWYMFFPAGGDKPLTVEQLRSLLENGDSPEDRAIGAAGLGERGDKQSVPLLLAAMEDESPLVRGRAAVAVKKILGTDFYFQPDGPVEQRTIAIQKYENLWDAWKEKTGYQDD